MDDYSEPTSDALARAAQALAVTLSVGEALARLHAHRAYERAEAADRQARADRADTALRAQQARLVWAPALDDQHLVRLSASELLTAWQTAHAWQDADPTAQLAAQRIQARLREVHPEAMAAYDDAVRAGATVDQALDTALPHFRGEYGLDPVGTPILFRHTDIPDPEPAPDVGDPRADPIPLDDPDQQAGPLRELPAPGVRDVVVLAYPLPMPRTPPAGTWRGAPQEALPPAPPVRIVVLAAYPIGMPDAMVSARAAAATAVTALPAPPHRRALTAATTPTPTPAAAR